MTGCSGVQNQKDSWSSLLFSLFKTVRSRYSDRLYLKSEGRGQKKKISNINFCATSACAYNYMKPNIPTHTPPP